MTSPTDNSFIYREELIRKLSVEPQFKAWMKEHTEAGYSHDDEWFLYNAKEGTIEHMLGVRISWFAGLSAEKSIRVTDGNDDYFPIIAQPFDYDGHKFWLMTCFGQGAISWIITDELFRKDYRIVE